MRLIDADKLLEAFRKWDDGSPGGWGLHDCEITIHEQPEIHGGFKDGYRQAKEDLTAKYAEIECKLSEKCNKLAEENKRLSAEKMELAALYDSMECEFARMRAQLDIVYLIFGGK